MYHPLAFFSLRVSLSLSKFPNQHIRTTHGAKFVAMYEEQYREVHASWHLSLSLCFLYIWYCCVCVFFVYLYLLCIHLFVCLCICKYSYIYIYICISFFLFLLCVLCACLWFLWCSCIICDVHLFVCYVHVLVSMCLCVSAYLFGIHQSAAIIHYLDALGSVHLLIVPVSVLQLRAFDLLFLFWFCTYYTTCVCVCSFISLCLLARRITCLVCCLSLYLFISGMYLFISSSTV